jgi:ubiquinone/menaquinone biosynthesis C-methylase UbiE
MLARGRRLVDSPRTPWVQAVAVPLPFTEGGFDVVVCLEVIEFTPDPAETLSELVRVLRPGGWLLITNRVGWEAALILGKTRSRARFPNWLRGAGLTEIEVYPWQVDYDLVWARKPIPDLTPSMER